MALWRAKPLTRSSAAWPDAVAPSDRVVVFDGVCNLCNGSVQFLLRRERSPSLKFAAAQSATGAALLQCYGRNVADLNSILLIDNGQAYEKADAALTIIRQLRWPWQWLQLGWLAPRFLRDAVYSFIAKHRYRWFGQREECMIPTKEIRERFLP